MRSRDLSEQKIYWLNQFEEVAPALEMPLDYPRPAKQSFKGMRIEKIIDRTLTAQIKAFAKEHQVTEYMVFLSVLMILLGKYSKQEDIIIGSPISGRIHQDTEKILGMFINILAMRGKPEGKKKYQLFLEEIKELCLKAYENQEYPFEALVEEVVTQRDMSRHSLFDVTFVMQNNEQVEVAFNNVKIESMAVDFPISKFDLSLSITETSEGYHLIVEYCTDLYQTSTINVLVNHYIGAIKQVLNRPTLTLADIEMNR
jgi:surfactin family lipopeptide synthetase A